MGTVMMKCGHAANATYEGGKPCCVICAGITPNAYIVDDNPPDLKGRESQCPYCKSIVPSDASLPFFEHRPKKIYDQHYDGCRGWD